MSTFEFDADWNEVKGKLRQAYGQLTDDDLQFVQGKGEELLGRLQEKLGMAREDLEDLLNEMKSGIGPVRHRISQAKAKVGEVAEELKSRAGDMAVNLKAAASAQAERAYDGAKNAK